MPFPADSRIKPPIVCLHLKLSPWQAAAGSCRGRGSPWEGALKSRTPPMTSPVPQHLPAVTAPTHPDFHLQMFILLLPTCFSSRPPAPELIHLKIIKLYEFCCRAKPCHPTCSSSMGALMVPGDAQSRKGGIPARTSLQSSFLQAKQHSSHPRAFGLLFCCRVPLTHH